MRLKILSDQHIGVKRVAGTTANSSVALEKAVIDNFRHCLLGSEPDNHTVILGDLTDKFAVNNSTLLDIITTLTCWLGEYPSKHLILVRGNHDMSNRADVMSSVDFIGELLSTYGNFEYVTKPITLGEYVIIPHLANQEQFDLAVSEADSEYLLAHCNYSLHFAETMDHSLNLSKEQASKFKRVYIGHEHVYRKVDNVVAFGNQFPTSVSDCLGGDDKIFHIVDGQTCETVESWSSDCIDVDWHEIGDISSQFVRVSGRATAEEANTVISEINKLRRRSDAYVIANAVEVEGLLMSDSEIESISTVEGLNVTTMLLDRLSKEHRAVLEDLI